MNRAVLAVAFIALIAGFMLYINGAILAGTAQLAPLSALPDNLTSRLERLEQDVDSLKERWR
jgi:hypothetical protein